MPIIHPHSVAIIGAGPAGLAVATCLKQRKISTVILEKTDKVASKWSKHYDRLHLHTHKDYSYLPEMKFPDSDPVFPSRDQVRTYFENYAKKFKHLPIFNTKVESIKKRHGLWEITTDQGELKARHVVLATGRNCEPKEKTLEVLKNYSGQILHASDYKNGIKFKNKKILVVGSGNTGAEIAVDLLESGAKPSWCVRNPTYIAPLYALGSATQVTNIRMTRFPMSLTDPFTKFFLKWTIGDLSSYGIETPKEGPREHMLGKGRTPIIDVGTVAAVKSGQIKVVKGIKSSEGSRIIFEDDFSDSFEGVIIATGYKTGLDKIIENSYKYLNDFSLPIDDTHKIEKDNIYFLGVKERGTGVLYEINKESQRIAKKIAEDLKIATQLLQD